MENLIESNQVETDAVHPRFQSRAHLLFSCPRCGVTKPSEARIKRHFLKKGCFPINSACTECGGPVFRYKFGPTETRLVHDCGQWAEYLRRHGSSYCDADSLTDSQATLSTDNGDDR